MTRALVVVLATLLIGLAAGCTGDDSESTPTDTGAADTTRPVALYLVREGKVAPVRRVLSAGSDDPITLALRELYVARPTPAEQAAGYTNAVACPVSGATSCGGGLDILDGVAHVTSGTHPARLAQAQVVYTLTRFPEVKRVVFVVDGKEGRPVTRADFEAQTPQILVESPLPGDTVRSPVRLRGTANVFEATVSIDVRDASDKLLKQTFTTATSGTGTRGTFDTRLALPDRAAPVTVVAYEASAKDGTPLHVVRVPLELAR